MKRRSAICTVLAASVALLAGACGGSSSGPGGGGHSTLTVAVFNPYTGPDASFGPEESAGCWAGVTALNQAGGVMGHHFTCIAVDTRGDPADAVPAAQQLLATNPNVVAVIGPSFDQAHIPMFADTGEASFDRSNYHYFYRLTPADDVKGYAMAIWAHEHGYASTAPVFANDISSQSNVPTLVRAIGLLGDKIAINVKIADNQPSYRTEVERLIQTNPQALYTEAGPATDATFLTELQQLHGLIPIIGTDASIQHAWLTAVAAAIGENSMKKYFVGEQPYAPPGNAAWKIFVNALQGSGSHVPKPSQWHTDAYAMTNFDSIIITALAMVASHSVNPTVYNAYYDKVTAAGPGKTVVTSFQAGAQALKSGKQIQYLGAGGPIAFDKWNNSTGGFAFMKYVGGGTVAFEGEVSAAQIAQLEAK
jgi:ABC-type branched-subunit amino acid transport system substrate-binding protein